MSDLKILVVGGAGTGKSTVSVLIQQALSNAGFSNVELIDNELTENDRARILADEWDNDKWKQRLNVTIEQRQTARIGIPRRAQSLFNQPKC